MFFGALDVTALTHEAANVIALHETIAIMVELQCKHRYNNNENHVHVQTHPRMYA